MGTSKRYKVLIRAEFEIVSGDESTVREAIEKIQHQTVTGAKSVKSFNWRLEEKAWGDK